MNRKDIYLTDEQVTFLEKLTGTVSEHVRRAIDHYINTIKGDKTSSSKSRKESD